jgi:hypothetical protein
VLNNDILCEYEYLVFCRLHNNTHDFRLKKNMKTSTKTKIVIGELPSADITQLTLHSELGAVIGGAKYKMIRVRWTGDILRDFRMVRIR